MFFVSKYIGLRSIILLLIMVQVRALSVVSSRRKVIINSCILSISSSSRSVSAAIIQKQICEQGQGEGCVDLAGDSELLRELQLRSAEKRAERDKASLERYNYNNFGDYFAAGFPPRKLVRHADGRFEALTDSEIETGIKTGKIGRGSYGTGWSNYQGRNPLYFIEEEGKE
uniref:Uncharacterized protein n=1 Tax=Aureoumbra lagunensis TaxID=44058 RepID=A0A7S3NIM4_9STRA|mmetsp:Transcript_12627/g.17002  ORF Transcript_12627/g.17002 Transcript_12627/m.17002 type:complete len:171 (+) Transcript_12627:66-578(+)